MLHAACTWVELARTSLEMARDAALIALLATASAANGDVQVVDAKGMQQLVADNEKVVLLMHSDGCERGESFAPTLERIAAELPALAFGRISVGDSSGLATRFAVQQGAPSLRAMFRNAPPSQRMLEYRGLPSYDAVLEWCQAVHAWDGGDTPPEGWHVGKDEEAAAPKRKKKKKPKVKDEV